MPQRIFSFLIGLIFIINGEVFAQIKSGDKPHPVRFTPLSSNEFIIKKKNYIDLFSASEKKLINNSALPFSAAIFLQKNAPDQSIYSRYAAKMHGSFFCRNERRLEQATGVPLKVRLGSLAYVDYLEKKPNAVSLLR